MKWARVEWLVFRLTQIFRKKWLCVMEQLSEFPGIDCKFIMLKMKTPLKNHINFLKRTLRNKPIFQSRNIGKVILFLFFFSLKYSICSIPKSPIGGGGWTTLCVCRLTFYYLSFFFGAGKKRKSKSGIIKSRGYIDQVT